MPDMKAMKENISASCQVKCFSAKRKYLDFFYDVYNKQWKKDICITLTADANTSFTHCGTVLIVQEVEE